MNSRIARPRVSAIFSGDISQLVTGRFPMRNTVEANCISAPLRIEGPVAKPLQMTVSPTESQTASTLEYRSLPYLLKFIVLISHR